MLLGAVDPADVGRAADLLAAGGITVRVIGPDGLAATIGAGASSRVGKLVTGSSAVGPMPLAAVRIALRTPTARTIAAGAAVVIIAVALRWRRG